MIVAIRSSHRNGWLPLSDAYGIFLTTSRFSFRLTAPPLSCFFLTSKASQFGLLALQTSLGTSIASSTSGIFNFRIPLAARDTEKGSYFITYDISCFFLFPSVSPTGAEKPFCPSAQLTLTFSSHLAAAGKHCCSSHLSFHARGLADGYDSSSGNKHKGHSFFQKGCRRGRTTVPSRPAL